MTVGLTEFQVTSLPPSQRQCAEDGTCAVPVRAGSAPWLGPSCHHHPWLGCATLGLQWEARAAPCALAHSHLRVHMSACMH
eukprot:scaffold93251_cov18-Tisochrysis_lutea.AAC.1